jgi:hypothetical protein
VAERVDATDLKSVGRKALQVRVLPGALKASTYEAAHGSLLEALAFPPFVWPEHVRVARGLQRQRLFDAMAIVQIAASVIAHEIDCESIGTTHFPRALQAA